MNTPNNICARLTPSGRGAVAVIGARGPLVESVLDRHFEPVRGNPYSQIQNRKVVYGVWRSTGEDLILTRRGLDHFEVHCHGGNSASAAILLSFEQSNVAQVSAETFALAFDSQWVVNTLSALAEAPTTKTAKLLLGQLSVLPAAIEQLKRSIDSNDREPAISQIKTMLKWAKFGIHLTRPRSIVLCGQPNVGKSSLVNEIVGFQRAIVHDIPGTTRDVVSQLSAIDGWPIELKDTAGIREATNSIEAIGIEKAKAEIDSADLKICVFDCNQIWSEQDQQLLDEIEPDLIVCNKIDLATENTTQPAPTDGLRTSVQTGQGIAALIESIGVHLVPELPDSLQAFPVTVAQERKLANLTNWLDNPQQLGKFDIDNFSVNTC